MAGRNRIRWNDSDEKELSRLVRNFNAKVTRISKKDPEVAKYMPDKVSVPELKRTIETRQDLKRQLNSLKRFTKRGSEELVSSEYGLTVSKWERNEVAIQVRTINNFRGKRRKILESLPLSSRGEPIIGTVREMQSEEMNAYKPKTYNFNKMKKNEWEQFVRTVRKMSSTGYTDEIDSRLKDNYIKSLHTVFDSTGVDISNIEEMVKKVSMKKFLNTFYSDTEASIDFVYDETDYIYKLEIIEHIWEQQTKN